MLLHESSFFTHFFPVFFFQLEVSSIHVKNHHPEGLFITPFSEALHPSKAAAGEDAKEIRLPEGKHLKLRDEGDGVGCRPFGGKIIVRIYTHN